MDLVGQGVKFVFELYIRQKFGMNIKFPEMDNCIMIYFKLSFFLGVKGHDVCNFHAIKKFIQSNKSKCWLLNVGSWVHGYLFKLSICMSFSTKRSLGGKT